MQILKSHILIFKEKCKLNVTFIKFGDGNFIFLQFDTKQWNHRIKYSVLA